MTKGRIGLFFWEGYLSVAPSLINAIRVLAEHGYQVDVITRRPTSGEFAPPPPLPSSVRILIESPRRELASGSNSVKGGGGRSWLRRQHERMEEWWEVGHFVQFAARSVKSARYQCFIGVDAHGLIAAFGARLLRRVPIIYWSLEIQCSSDLNGGLPRLLKRLERICHRRAAFMIIQDLERAASLTRENLIADPNAVIVPNGPLGWPQLSSSDFLQKKFRIANGRRVVLQLGTISPSFLSLEIASEAAKWKEDVVLVFHERAKRAQTDAYIRQVREAGRGKVLLSLEPVPYDALDSVVMSGHIGLVFYQRARGLNFSQIAGASGKLAHYLRCGLPVICLDLPGLVRVINEYRCGICVSDPREVESAVEAILRDYEFYRANARKCYEERYEFGRHFKQVLGLIEEFGESENGQHRGRRRILGGDV